MMFFVPTIHSYIDKFGWMDCKVATEYTLTAELVIVERERGRERGSDELLLQLHHRLFHYNVISYVFGVYETVINTID